MAINRIRHDAAWACALSFLELLENWPEEAKQVAFAELYQRIVAAIEAYDIQRLRELRRLGISEN